MKKCKPETLTSQRANPLYTTGLILAGNGKLLDYYDDGNKVWYRYAQFNTRAIIDCPFRSAGCERICYATKGNHTKPSVKGSRIHSAEESRRQDFSDAVVYTVRVEKKSKRYKDAVMLIRIHESGDFYSVQYLRKWVKAWAELEHEDGVQFVFYTKSFPFFLMLTDDEKAIINRMLSSGKLAINLSIDDTTNPEQKIAYLKCIATFPKANTYICTEHVEDVEHDNVCDCADCAKCGTCNRGTGKKTVVKIHSASKNDMIEYRKNKADA